MAEEHKHTCMLCKKNVYSFTIGASDKRQGINFCVNCYALLDNAIPPTPAPYSDFSKWSEHRYKWAKAILDDLDLLYSL